MVASLIASLLLYCKRRVPVPPSIPSLRSPHGDVAHRFARLASHGGVAHCLASLALQTACARGAAGPLASLVTRRPRSLLRSSRVAISMCLLHRRPSRRARHITASLIASLLLRHMTALLIASLLLRCVAPSVPSLRSLHDGAAHCFASLASHTAMPVALSVPSLRSSHDSAAHCFASLASPTALPVAPSVPSRRSSHDGVAHCFSSLTSQTAGAYGAASPFVSLVTRRRRSLLCFS